MKKTLLILAAGIGSRYGGLKQLDQVGPSGETIIDYSVYDAIRAGFEKAVFIIRKDIENDFKETLLPRFSGKIEVDYVFQEIDNLPEGIECPAGRKKPWGTAHAVLAAAPAINEPFAVINADDFYGYDAFKVVADYFNAPGFDPEKDYCVVGYRLGATLSEHGGVARGVCKADAKGLLTGIVERTEVKRVPEGIVCKGEDTEWMLLPEDSMASMNFWGFTPSVFNYSRDCFKEFIAKSAEDLKAELYIPSVINKIVQEGLVNVKLIRTSANWFGFTYREEKETVIKNIRVLVDEGNYPESLWK